MLKETKKNDIYELAKKITSIMDDESKEKVFVKTVEKLNELIAKNLEDEESNLIEDAIEKALEDESGVIFEVLTDEINYEIENVLFEEGETEFDSTMYLMPCILVSNRINVNIPSINQIEEEVRLGLLEAGLISDKSQFNVGTIRLGQDDLDEMSIRDWWVTHRDIIDEGSYSEKEKSDNDNIRNAKTTLERNQAVSLFYFVVTIVNKDNNKEICDLIYDSQLNTELWSNMANKFSDENNKFTILPAMPVDESMDNADVILEMVNFELFFEDSAYEENTEIGYIKISDAENQYAVLFFDGESNLLNRFYKYDTEGDNDFFVSNLIELCLKNPERTLYSFEKSITMKTLNLWREAEDIVDISDLLKEANQIDLVQAYQFCSLLEKIDVVKPTIH